MANDPVYSLDLNGGQTWGCTIGSTCSEQGGRSSFWRRNDMPEKLVPVGWKVHLSQDGLIYTCPICYQQDLEDMVVEHHPQYIEIHHPGQVESTFRQGGIPIGGKRRRKRKRRKKKTKKTRRKKRRRKKRTKRRK